MNDFVNKIASEINRINDIEVSGSVASVRGLLIECAGINNHLSIGAKCRVISKTAREVPCEVIGFKDGMAMLMPFTETEGIGTGCKVLLDNDESVIHPDISWKGRVINAFAEPIDEKGPLLKGTENYMLRAKPPMAHQRRPVKGKIDLAIRAINTFVTCCRGQRLGIFAGSGVGKSVMMSMMARYSAADVKVIGLIGERGREVHEFIHEYLGEEGLRNSIIVVATSDESPLMRKHAAYVTLAVAEYFRDLGQDVLLMMDSVTRFAMAQREIGLSVGEPPASKGYTPTVFSELPKLLERAGPGINEGTITGLFSVLVEGDDHNEPIADSVRGILDGHIMLERSIAERGRFPAINVLKSVSRTMPKCNTPEENMLVERARALLSTYDNMAEMIRLGAYRKGSSVEVDEAIKYFAPLENFLKQDINDHTDLLTGYQMLSDILNTEYK